MTDTKHGRTPESQREYRRRRRLGLPMPTRRTPEEDAALRSMREVMKARKLARLAERRKHAGVT